VGGVFYWVPSPGHGLDDCFLQARFAHRHGGEPGRILRRLRVQDLVLGNGDSPEPSHAKKKYPDELLDRGARLVFESGRPVTHVARDLGINSEILRRWVRQAEADTGKRKELLSSEEQEELKVLRGEVRDLRPNEILKSASAFFAAELDPHRTK
jgi:transposase